MPIPYYYQLSSQSTLKALKSSLNGLKNNEVKQRQEKFGYNQLEEVAQETWYQILLKQFSQIMVVILIVAMAISFLLGETLDGIAILLIVILNAVIGFIQEYKAEKTIEALKHLTNPQATVIRNKQIQKILAKDLVPGDIILLEEGEKIPADGRLLEVAELQVSEASLTGESNPISKQIEAISKKSGVGDRLNMVYLGTVITRGHAKAIVTKIGMQSEFGKIAKMVQDEKSGPSPLQKQLNRLSKHLAILTLLIIAMLMATSLYLGKDLIEMFILSISLAVSVIPEGLPAVITLTLAISVQQMAKKNALIRKLPAAETLGSTSVICTDKTGTLTKNQMTVQKVFCSGQEYSVSGIGYAPKGYFFQNDSKIKVDTETDLLATLRSAALCNNSELIKNKKTWDIFGDPTEAALLTVAQKAKLKLSNLHKSFPRIKEFIFDSERKLMSTLNQAETDYELHSKGAPDQILEKCSFIQIGGKKKKLTAKLKQAILEQNASYAKEAYRVLGVAKKEVKNAARVKEENLIFLGLIAMMDPPRSQVKQAIQKCKSAHIQVIMITGDHALTALAIAKKIGLFQEGDRVLSGNDLDKMSATELKKAVNNTRIFARVSPKHKVAILKALQANKQVVAMTGDGVNDAPALKKADIGIAMGITGSDVSKEASQMILMDDNFKTIVNAVESGRIIYANIKKFIRFLLSSNFDEIIVISIVFAMGLPIPFIPLQILWINLMTDALPAIALGIDTPEKDIMQEKPRNPNSNVFKELIGFSLVAGIIASAISLYLFFSRYNHESIEHLRTMVFTTAVVFELFLSFSVRSETKHYFHNFFKNKLLWIGVIISFVLQLIVIYTPAMQEVFETVALNLMDWLEIIGLTILGMGLLEIWKWLRIKS